MSLLDPNNPDGPLGFIFGAKATAGIPTYTQLQMRRKIAESLLGQRNKYPKTFGEGLSAIGEAIGDRGMMNKLDAMDQAREGQIGPEYNRAMGVSPPASAPPTGRPMSYAPEDTGAPLAAADSNVPSWNQFAQEQSPGGLGLAPAQAAGLVGNLQAESGAGINPNAPPGDAGTAFGSAQWRGPRLAALQQYAARQGLDPMTTAAQQGFMRQEMIGQGNNRPTEGGAYSALTRTSTPASAATAVDRLYERSSGEHLGRRINNAQKIMQSVGPQSSVVDPGLNQSVALDQTAPPAPAGPPMAFSGQPTSDAPPMGAPPDARAAIAGAIAPKPPPVVAPPVPPPPPPVQIAQAPPQPQIRVPEREPTPPVRTTNPQINELAVLSGKLDPNDPRQRGLQLRSQQLQAIDEATYAQKFEEYKHKRDRYETAPEKAAALEVTRQAATKAANENKLREQFGNMPPEDVFKTIGESKKMAQSAVQSLAASREAMDAYHSGIILGAGADWRLTAAKFLTGMGLTGEDVQKKIANTETFRGAMQPVIANLLHQTSGTSQLSNTELSFAEHAAAGRISLDEKTIPKLMGIIDKASRGVVTEHQQKMDVLFGDNAKPKALYGVEAPKASENSDALKWLHDNPKDPRAPAVRKKLGI